MNNLRPRVAWISVLMILLLTFVLYQQQVLYLVSRWNQFENEEYAHGYLILMISAYLIYYNRRRLVALTPCQDYRAILAIVFASMIWMLAAFVGIELLQVIGLLLLVLSIVWALLGIQIARILVFPILYISFAIPVWFKLTPFLQELTADSVFWLVRVIEIPALRIDNMIVLPSGKLSIKESCAGMRYLMAALILGVLYAYLNYTTFRGRLIIALVTVVAAVLANILRVFIVVYYGYKTDMQHPYVDDHVFLGWYIFGGLVVVLLMVEALLHRRFSPDLNSTQGEIVYKPSPCDKRKLQFSVFVLVVTIFVSIGPVTVLWMNSQPQSGSYSAQIKLPLTTGAWSYVDTNEDNWTPHYRGAINHKMTFQNKSNHVIHLYIGIYPTQSQDGELINELNRISDGKVWYTKYERAKQYSFSGQQVLEQLLEKSDGTQRLVWYWYNVAGQDAVNKYHAKALQLLGLLNGKRQASIVAIAVKLDDEPETTRKILSQFTAEVVPLLTRAIDYDR